VVQFAQVHVNAAVVAVAEQEHAVVEVRIGSEVRTRDRDEALARTEGEARGQHRLDRIGRGAGRREVHVQPPDGRQCERIELQFEIEQQPERAHQRRVARRDRDRGVEVEGRRGLHEALLGGRGVAGLCAFASAS
jgi:hypothetical protein